VGKGALAPCPPTTFFIVVVGTLRFAHPTVSDLVSAEGDMAMFSHVMIGTNDLDKAKTFYDKLLGTLEVRPARVDGHRIFYITKTGVFSVSKPINGEAATPANGGTIGFACNSPEQVDAWHAAGLASGGKTCENPPGIREGSAGKLYLAYLRDLDGNKICAMHRLA